MSFYLPELEQQLRHAIRAQTQLDDMPRSALHRRTATAVALGASAAIAVAVVLVVLSAGTRSPRRVPMPTATHPLTGPYTSFEAFRRPRRASDAISTPTRAGTKLLVAHMRLELGQSRRIFTSLTETWWLVPARTHGTTLLCLLMSDARGGGGAACGPKNIFLGESSTSTHGHQIGETELNAVLTTRFRALKVTLNNGHTVILTPNRDGAIAYKHRSGVRRAVPIPVSIR